MSSSAPEAVAALKLTLGARRIVVARRTPSLGTITAWVLVRDDFRGKSLVNAVIDLPFALPTIVAGLVLLALYGPHSPVGINIAFTRTAIVLALLFVTLPFVVRTVQPVLLELDTRWRRPRARSARSELAIFRRIVLPTSCRGSSPASRWRSRARSARSARSCSSRGTSRSRPRSRRSSSSTTSRAAIRTGAAAVAVVMLVDLVRGAARDRRDAPPRHEARTCVGVRPARDRAGVSGRRAARAALDGLLAHVRPTAPASSGRRSATRTRSTRSRSR